MVNLKFLGRGSAFNTKEGNTSAYFIRNDALFLIDCGETVFVKILELNLLKDTNIKKVYVLITHLHSDHVGSLSSFILYCYFNKKIKPRVFCNDRNITKLLNINGSLKNQYWVPFKLKELEEYGLEVEAIKNNHVQEIKSYSFKIRDVKDNTRILYTGDIKTNKEFVEKYYKGCDIIYHDCSYFDSNAHTTYYELCELIPDRDERHDIYLMHIDSHKLKMITKYGAFKIVEVEGE